MKRFVFPLVAVLLLGCSSVPSTGRFFSVTVDGNLVREWEAPTQDACQQLVKSDNTYCSSKSNQESLQYAFSFKYLHDTDGTPTWSTKYGFSASKEDCDSWVGALKDDSQTKRGVWKISSCAKNKLYGGAPIEVIGVGRFAELRNKKGVLLREMEHPNNYLCADTVNTFLKNGTPFLVKCTEKSRRPEFSSFFTVGSIDSDLGEQSFLSSSKSDCEAWRILLADSLRSKNNQMPVSQCFDM